MKDGDEQRGSDAAPENLIKLGSYAWPRSETRQTLGHLYEKIKTGLLPDLGENAVDTDTLTSVTDAALKARVCDRLVQRLHQMLDHSYLDWAKADATGNNRRRAFVHPPMKDNVLSGWAEQHGFAVLEPGNRLDDHRDAPCVTVPRLESFFSRDHRQLSPIFHLFEELSGFNGRVLVGCNSWAWRFLQQFDDALLLFGEAETIPAFDAEALATLLERALPETNEAGEFTSVESGDPILAWDKDGALKDPYLEELAGHSLGHPFVAIEMFFQGIAETKDSEKQKSQGRVWVDLPAACSLPTTGSDALLFALHALMIHGPRAPEDFDALLPHRVPNGVWSELERIGFVEMHEGRVHCAIRNYPDIRSELGAAGFNLDRL